MERGRMGNNLRSKDNDQQTESMYRPPHMRSLGAFSKIFNDQSEIGNVGDSRGGNSSDGGSNRGARGSRGGRGALFSTRGSRMGRGRGSSGNTSSERNENNTENYNRPYRIGFKKLEEYLNEEPDQLILKLLSASAGFSELILTPDLSFDYIVLIMKVLSRMSESTFTSNKTKILEKTTADGFLTQLTQFMMNMALQNDREQRRARYFWNDPDDFFRNVNNYCDMILTLSPTTAVEILKKLLKAALIVIPHFSMISTDTKDTMTKIEEKLNTYEEELMSRYKKKEIVIDERESEPPDDFRSISLYPLPIEITNRTKAFVRKNIIEGPYKNVDHYLDIQFRLLREDFVKPLREGICDYKEGNKKIQNIKIYQNVKFLAPHMVNSICGVLIQLHIKNSNEFKKKLENSRRFMFGSLVCFTSNNFRSLIFGKIVDRRAELLQNGQLVIEFETGIYDIDFESQYLMTESSVYFEPYYHVLKALQQLHEGNFPMRKYIIEVSNEKQLPRYLPPSSPPSSDYDSDSYEGVIEMRRIEVDYPDLNEAQYEAYQSAMNESFSIIQGPPGTGKTFLGLVVAKSLLVKQAEWHHGRYPLLVVCFTNHALDQFLEGLVSATDEVVRIGGQSKNQNLDKYNIKSLRKTSHKRLTRAFYDAREQVQTAHRELKRLHALLDNATDFSGIVNILDTVKSLPENLGSWFEIISAEELENWLIGDHVHNQMKPSSFEMSRMKNSNNPEVLELINNIADDPNAANYFNAEDEIFDTIHTSHVSQYIVSVASVNDKIRLLSEKRTKMGEINHHNYENIIKIENEIQQSTNILDYLKMRMTEGRQTTEFRFEGILSNEPHNIHPDDRWNLYFYWLDKYRAEIKEKIDECRNQYQHLYEAYEEVREIEDIELMRRKLVVGMTTTGAARLQGSLRALKSPIVIVEEAAEIMESHVITSLTEHCTHLILIGDHQQLRPSTADYTMEKQYYLGISLFERMVRNKINCNLLTVQHRMRPEIAKLIAPNIYPNLQNHKSVYDFPPVRGIDRCLYFITHKYPEEESADQSKSNVHEVRFLLRLAKYLLLNGYEPEDITIIAAYSGQMFLMFRERKKFELLKEVRITVLDNYQGEESKIILLSLVRNNDNNKIGFLSLENRICVALSRAREGLYIMGNMDLLCENSSIWQKVRNVLEEQDSLGTSLPLRCQIHRDKVTAVANESDFQKVSEGGCDLICGQILACGHQCKSCCHILNRDHNKYLCQENCTRVLCDNGHICPKRCFKECGNCQVPMLRHLECGHEAEFPCYQTEFKCYQPVSVELTCNHRVDNKPCYIDVEQFQCPYSCDIRIDTCGHTCTRRCHISDDPDHLKYKCYKPCAEYRKNCSMQTPEHICTKYCFEECPDCDIVVRKKRSCFHFYDIRCSVDVETISCKKPCKKTLSCGHRCKLECQETCGNCNVKVKKTIPECGHEVEIECSKVPTVGDCKQKCILVLPCGHNCKNKCKEKCSTKCDELVDSVIPLGCGHSSRIPCFMNTAEYIRQNAQETVMECKEACNANLECGHICSGSCGECYQGRIHKICLENCGVDLVCGHKCTVPCRQICPPCFQKCMYKCSHNRCGRKCGEMCKPCKEPCPRRCPHVKCKAWCSSKCTVEPCIEPCMAQLRCGHECIGFCGEPCPPLCKICNRDELLEFYLGYEEEEDARFVLLQECGHVVESRGMEMWLQSGENEIAVKRCPRCRTPLTITRRYHHYIRDSIEQVQKVKEKFFGNQKENMELQQKLVLRLKDIYPSFEILSEISTLCFAVYTDFCDRLKPTINGKRQTVSKILGQILMSKIQIFEQICRLYEESSQPTTNEIITYIDFLLRRLILVRDRMSTQEVNDYTLEIKRLSRMLQLCDMKKKYPRVRERELYTCLESKLFSFEKHNDDRVKHGLETLSKQMGGVLIVTEKEMEEIVKAIGVKQGAWYKCPNGHPYAIGDCGGANQIANCADCAAKIGGTRHTLLADNAHFGVDGATYAAWSEEANMLNYEFNFD